MYANCAGSNPAIASAVNVFPEPERPKIATVFPASTVKETSFVSSCQCVLLGFTMDKLLTFNIDSTSIVSLYIVNNRSIIR